MPHIHPARLRSAMEHCFENEVYRNGELSVPDRRQMCAIASCSIILFELVAFDTKRLVT
jgi:hypothetical protein